MDIRKRFAATVARHMKKKNMSRIDLSREAGIAPSTVTRILAGEMDASLRMVEKVAGAFDVSPLKLLD